MAQARKTKGGQVKKMKSILIEVPADLHTVMKTRAAEQQKTLKGIIIEALRRAFEKGEKKA